MSHCSHTGWKGKEYEHCYSSIFTFNIVWLLSEFLIILAFVFLRYNIEYTVGSDYNFVFVVFSYAMPLVLYLFIVYYIYKLIVIFKPYLSLSHTLGFYSVFFYYLFIYSWSASIFRSVTASVTFITE